MAKRFINTEFFKSPFVRSLKGPLKTLYSFIICDCSGSGIWVKDLEISSVYIGFSITEKEWKESFIDTGKAIDLKDGKFFFPDFIEHQYPNGLQSKNPAHKNFIEELKKYNLIDGDLKVLQRPSKGSKVMVKVMEEVKVTAKEEVNDDDLLEIWPTFNDFWDEYDKKRGDKSKVESKWGALSQKDKERIMNYIPDYKLSQPDKQYRKDPITFLNNKSWNDELIFNNGKQKGNTAKISEYLYQNDPDYKNL